MMHTSMKNMVLASAGCLLAACASTPQISTLQTRPEEPSQGAVDTREAKYAVGIRWQAFSSAYRQNWDGTGPRPMNSVAFYPAALDARMYDINVPEIDPIFLGGIAAPNAPIAKHSRKYPLVMLSHGTGGSALQMMWLGRRLAEQGYIAVAIDHHGNTAAEDTFDPRGFMMPWERAKDMTEVIDALFVASPMQDQMDPDDISAIGFSLGGYTVTSLAGGLYDRERFAAFCQSDQRDAVCEPQVEFPEAVEQFAQLLDTDKRTQYMYAQRAQSVKNKRVRRVIAIAPALGQAISDESLEGIVIPFMVIVGNADKTAPLSTNAKRLADKIPNASLKMLEGVGHYAFLNICSEKGKNYVSVCQDEMPITRSDVHDETAKRVLAFLAEHRGE